ncbi:Ankyrin repeat and protein kinase domain-containing protein 1 [Daphnia magna]|uniref:Ankyrin repeat and protein kinase domain-containing protein 1 n=1 Tax=Daphnia magna TaxID=35525 RepID=A0A165AJP2_9CRUS|nr:Ankyrin repeat and protein kinase domain-containing protein 1 [Daphnia magna]
MLLKRNGSLLELQVMDSSRFTPYDGFDVLYPANEIVRIFFNEVMRRILLEADVNATVDSVKLGYLAIQYAATKNFSSSPKIIEVLLEHGASPSSNGYTPFVAAARNEGHYALEMMKQLLDYRGSSNANELTLFLCCALINYGECGVALVELLLKNIKTEAIQFHEELLIAGLADEVHGLKKMKLILEKGVKPNPASKDKFTILHFAALHQTTQTLAIIETLLEYGSDLNASDESGNTPIHCAAINEGEHAYETMKFLLSKGGDVNIKRKDGLAPVHFAMLNRGICGDKMRKLLGVDQESFNVPIDNSGFTLLHNFVSADHAEVDVVQLILDHGGNPNTEDKSGISPLHSALQNHSQIGLTILQLLLQKGGNPNSYMGIKELRHQPVHHVAMSLNENAGEQMAILLENNGNANASNKDGLTPMHVAVYNPGIHAPKLVKILLNHGGNPNAGDAAGLTPVHYVISKKNSNSLEILKLLVENGGNIFQLDNCRMSPFIFAILQGSEKYCLPENQSVEILEILGKGNYGKVFKCNYTDESGKTYLAACKKCSPNPDAGDVFDREVETLNQLNHLFVVKYLDLVENQSKKYIVMELCEGSLKDYVEGKLERIPIDSLDDKILISQVALGVAYIHSKDIIHKDLKLANILLWCQSSNSRLVLAKIADFGFAKKLKLGHSEFSDTTHPGTENYRAPEVLNAQGSAYPASFASDVYAFGIIIVRIAKKGAHAYSSEDMWRKLSMVHGLVPQNIQDLSWDLQDLILKLTDRDPGKRPMMALVLRHPYFVLTNERTKKYFLDRLWVNIILCDDGIELFADKILSAQSLDEWYHGLSDYTDSSNANELTLFLCCALINYGECGVALVELLLKNIKTEAIQIYEELLCLVFVDEVHGLKKMKMILEKGVKPNPAGEDKFTILHYAVRQQTTQTLAIIETLLEYGCDLNASDESGNTPIHYAASNQGEHAYETMKFLLSKGGDVKIKRKDGIAPVHFALFNRGICGDKMRKLIGADQESYNVPIDNTGITLLHFFVSAKHAKVDVVQLILDHGGNPNTEDKSGISPVHSALQNHSQIGLTILQLLLQKGGNPNSFMGNKELRQQPVHHVALFLNENADEQMAILLENNGNANASNKYGLTPMHVAALNPGIHAPKLVKILLNHGGNPNAGDTAGHTPVHYVVREKRSSLEVLKLLVENGGNIFQLDNRRMSPFIYAIQRGSEKYCLPEVKNYLVERFLKNVFKVLVERKG